MEATLTVIGSANIDFIMQVEHLPAAGETVNGGRFSQAFGGKGANQAVAAAKAGGSVSFVAALGSDPVARSYLAHLRANDIDTTHVTLEPDRPGGTALITVDGKGENSISVAPGANLCMTPERVFAAEDLIARSAWIILQGEIPFEANRTVLELAAKHGSPVLLNYAPVGDLRLRPDAAVHGLVVNEVEATALSGIPTDLASAGQVAAQLRGKGGHRFVVITLGKEGSVFADGSGIQAVDAFPVDAVDTTAAGDTFCGALAVALSEETALPDAVRFASAASALAVTKVGAQTSIPTRLEIEALLQR